MSVKRYEVTLNHAGSDDPEAVMARDAFGNYVKYQDYAALEQKLAESKREFRAADATIENLQMQLEKLAAENAGLKQTESNLVRNIINDLGDTEFQYSRVQTPATDAFLAEVRARGVEMFADNLLCPDLDDTIREFAALLRKGGA